MDNAISNDTKAVLLLCGKMGEGRGRDELTPAQYRQFATALFKLDKRPADLLTDGNLADSACAAMEANARIKHPATPARIRKLLSQGVKLSVCLDKWAGCGIGVLSKSDTLYPVRMKEHLGKDSPVLIYYAGNTNLFSGGGMAFVGSREIGEEPIEAIRKVVRACVDNGKPIVSGGAKGADQTAMQEGVACGGSVVGVLPCNLLSACLEPVNRDALAYGKTLLFSAFDPEARPFDYGREAMARNKYIYAMADACFVAQSGIGSQSGTWAGVTEELKRKKPRSVFVYLASTPSEGCLDLMKYGAKPWDNGKTAEENLSAVSEKPQSYVQNDLFGEMGTAEETVPYGKPSELLRKGEN